MFDRNLILLGAGGAIGWICAYQTMFVLGLLEEWLAAGDGEFPRHPEIAFWQPSRAAMRRWDLYSAVVLVVFLFTSFQGVVAIRDSLGW